MKSILVVDDEEMFLKSLGMNLTHEGYEVAFASGGRKAIAKLREGRYNLVMTDLVMDDVDGLQVLKAAKDIDPALYVMIVTGYADLDSAIDALRLGADDYLLKPYDVDDLLLRISICLDRDRPKRVKTKGGYGHILPMCAVCKKVRCETDRGAEESRWISIEGFLLDREGIMVSHSYCPECRRKTLQEVWTLVTP